MTNQNGDKITVEREVKVNRSDEKLSENNANLEVPHIIPLSLTSHKDLRLFRVACSNVCESRAIAPGIVGHSFRQRM